MQKHAFLCGIVYEVIVALFRTEPCRTPQGKAGKCLWFLSFLVPGAVFDISIVLNRIHVVGVVEKSFVQVGAFHVSGNLLRFNQSGLASAIYSL